MSKSEYKEIHEIFAVYSDLKFITNTYRLKQYFHFAPEKIKAYVFMPSISLLSKKEIEELICSENAEKMLEALSHTAYKKGCDGSEAEDIEKWAREYKFNMYSKKIMYSTNPNTVMMCCFFLKENEVKNITHIIEGIKYEIEPSEIEKRLVGCIS